MFVNKFPIIVLLLTVLASSSSQLISATPTTPDVQNVNEWPLYYLVVPTSDKGIKFPFNISERSHNLQSHFTRNWKVVPACSTASNGTCSGSSSLLDSSNFTIIAEARYNDSLYDKGWNFLMTETNKSVGFYDTTTSVWEQKTIEFFITGFLEGYLTFGPLKSFQNAYSAWDSTVDGNPANVTDWFRNHINYMRAQVLRYNQTDRRWNMVGNLFQQMEAMSVGYSVKGSEVGAGRHGEANFLDMFAVNWAEMNGVSIHFLGPNYDSSGISDLQTLLRKPMNPKRFRKPGSTHCSALVRVTATDVYASQATWSSFFMMNRMFKTYRFSDGTFNQMSSYPGNIASLDDWYTTASLSVMETSVNVYNYSLYRVSPYEVVSEFLRVMMANYLSTTAEEWSGNFAWKQSGTYNNLYITTNLARIDEQHLATPANGNLPNLPPNTVYLTEQIPHHIIAGDVTQHVNEWGFFPGFNSPFFAETRRISGYDAEVAEYGPGFFSFYNYSRFEIFHRDAPKVDSIEKMQQIMRYNDYKHDPFSRIRNCSGTLPVDGVCDPPYASCNTIACRGDLMPANLGPHQLGPLWAALGQSMTTATDAKIVVWSKWKKSTSRIGAALIISGPPCSKEYDIPPFQFTTSPWPMPPPEGSPDVINYSWQLIVDDPTENHQNGNHKSNDGNAIGPAIGFSVVGGVVFVGVIVYFVWFKKTEKQKGSDGDGGLLQNGNEGDFRHEPKYNSV